MFGLNSHEVIGTLLQAGSERTGNLVVELELRVRCNPTTGWLPCAEYIVRDVLAGRESTFSGEGYAAALKMAEGIASEHEKQAGAVECEDD